MDADILQARTPDHIGDARRLFREYAEWLDRDYAISLDFQGIADELATLPGKYAPPTGELLLAYHEGEAAGCIALRPFKDETCEIKRLYVRPNARGQKLGQSLAAAVIERARWIGYRRAVLDTGGFMHSAQRIYETAGFRDIAPYYHNPIPGCRFLGADL